VELEPVMELKAAVSQVKTVEAGVSVSYGRTYVTDRETRIATVTIGYADGYPRLLSGRASVIIRGRKAPIIGRVCMDQLMIDVSGIPDVAEGDVVTLFGTDGEERITADELADIYGSIGYEIVCGISPRVPRIFIN
jgi:alanine racemase